MKILNLLRREESRLQKRANELGRELSNIRKALGALGSDSQRAVATNGRRRRTKRRRMSAAARRRISIAQKKRWARWAAQR